VTAQPELPQQPELPTRVPKTMNGIADALNGARRMEFYRTIGQAEAGPERQHLVATWWGQAMLDTDPERERTIAAVQTGTLPTVTMAEVFRSRRSNGVEMPGE
jgi:hypothetical protein